jgi:hypothetical protein
MLNLVKQADERAETVKVRSKHRIYTVLDIAGYIVNTNLANGIHMRRKRLDMYLYLIQLYSIMLIDSPMFNSTIFVRNHRWPYTGWMDNYCGNKYRIRSIPKIAIYWDINNGITELGKHKFNPHITMSDRKLLDTIIDDLNTISNKTLKRMLVNHGLIKQAVEREDKTITERMMVTYCERAKEFGSLVMTYIDECLRVL